MPERWYRLYCEYCNYNRLTKGDDIGDMNEVTVSAIPGGAPKLDPKTGKAINAPSKKPVRRWKCPGCGRLVFPKAVPPPMVPPEEPKKDDKPSNEPLPISVETPNEQLSPPN
mgnify:FL=1